MKQKKRGNKKRRKSESEDTFTTRKGPEELHGRKEEIGYRVKK